MFGGELPSAETDDDTSAETDDDTSAETDDDTSTETDDDNNGNIIEHDSSKPTIKR